ncbi:hypothetical protein ACVOMS_10900 [Bradyrhizobium guangxiense]
MAKPSVSRDAFRGLFALYALRAHHDRKSKGEECLLALFRSAGDIPDELLQEWSDKADLLGSQSIGEALAPRTRQIANGSVRYDHASDFLHSILRDLARKH